MFVCTRTESRRDADSLSGKLAAEGFREAVSRPSLGREDNRGAGDRDLTARIDEGVDDAAAPRRACSSRGTRTCETVDGAAEQARRAPVRVLVVGAAQRDWADNARCRRRLQRTVDVSEDLLCLVGRAVRPSSRSAGTSSSSGWTCSPRGPLSEKRSQGPLDVGWVPGLRIMTFIPAATRNALVTPRPAPRRRPPVTKARPAAHPSPSIEPIRCPARRRGRGPSPRGRPSSTREPVRQGTRPARGTCRVGLDGTSGSSRWSGWVETYKTVWPDRGQLPSRLSSSGSHLGLVKAREDPHHSCSAGVTVVQSSAGLHQVRSRRTSLLTRLGEHHRGRRPRREAGSSAAHRIGRRRPTLRGGVHPRGRDLGDQSRHRHRCVDGCDCPRPASLDPRYETRVRTCPASPWPRSTPRTRAPPAWYAAMGDAGNEEASTPASSVTERGPSRACARPPSAARGDRLGHRPRQAGTHVWVPTSSAAPASTWSARLSAIATATAHPRCDERLGHAELDAGSAARRKATPPSTSRMHVS